jgi:hypothetical protein
VPFGSDEGSVYGLAIGDLDGDGRPDIASARSSAPSTFYFNRPGPGRAGAEIRLSEHVEPRVPLLAPRPRDPAEPILGVWQGELIQGAGGVWKGPRLRGGESYEIELLVERLDAGVAAGRTIYHSSKSVMRCGTVYVLESRARDGSYMLRETTGDHCPVDDGSRFGIQLVGEDRLRLQFFSPEDRATPTLTVELHRKTGAASHRARSFARPSRPMPP